MLVSLFFSDSWWSCGFWGCCNETGQGTDHSRRVLHCGRSSSWRGRGYHQRQEQICRYLAFGSTQWKVRPNYKNLQYISFGHSYIFYESSTYIWNLTKLFFSLSWYRVETNYDHWLPTPKRDDRRQVDDRFLIQYHTIRIWSSLWIVSFCSFRDVAMKALNVTGQNHINMNTLYQVCVMCFNHFPLQSLLLKCIFCEAALQRCKRRCKYTFWIKLKLFWYYCDHVIVTGFVCFSRTQQVRTLFYYCPYLSHDIVWLGNNFHLTYRECKHTSAYIPALPQSYHDWWSNNTMLSLVWIKLSVFTCFFIDTHCLNQWHSEQSKHWSGVGRPDEENQTWLVFHEQFL